MLEIWRNSVLTLMASSPTHPFRFAVLRCDNSVAVAEMESVRGRGQNLLGVLFHDPHSLNCNVSAHGSIDGHGRRVVNE